MGILRVLRYRKTTKNKKLYALLILLCGAFLLFFRLEALSFSVDEFYNIDIDVNRPLAILQALKYGADLHPPFSHFISHGWIRIFGASEWAARSVWALIGVLIIAMTYTLGRTIAGSAAGMLGAGLLISLSTFLLYTRFVKYYSLTMAVALMTAIIFISWIRRPSAFKLCIYIGALTLYLYTDYFGPATWILWSNFIVLSRMLRHSDRLPVRLWKWLIIGQVIAGVLWFPWIFWAFLQADRVFSMKSADLGGSVLGFILNIAQACYAFSVGETVFPWHIAGISGVVIVVIATIYFLRVLFLKKISSFVLWPLSYTVLSLLVVSLLASTLIQGVPFIAFANHTLFILPFFTLWLSIGLLKIQSRYLRYGAIAGLLLARLVGSYHYFIQQDFQNPIYIVPVREITAKIAKEVSDSDLVLAAPDIGIAFYAQRTIGWETPILDPCQNTQSQKWIDEHHPARIWFFVFGRDRTQTSAPAILQEWIAKRCHLETEQGYAEQDMRYRFLKTLLFKRPAYQYKLTLYQYTCQ